MPHRGRRLLALVLGAAVIAAAVGIPVAIVVSRGGVSSTVTPPAASATPNPSQRAAAAQASALYAEAMTAAERSAGFAYKATSSGDGSTLLTVTGVAGQDDGSQVFDETTGYGDEQFSLVLAPDQTVYFQGNAAAIEDQLGVSAAGAPALAGEWVSAVIGDGPYKDMEVGITVGSQLSEVILDPTSTEAATGSDGAPVTRILGSVPATSGNTAGTGRLDIATGSDLPATYEVAYSGAATQTETFSAWGTAPSLTVPSTAVAWSTLTTSEPPDGYGSGVMPSAAPAPTPTPTPAPRVST
jgi:hypothetical protein